MGLFAVARLAARHGIRVRLRPGEPQGLSALVWLPGSLTKREQGPVTRQLPLVVRPSAEHHAADRRSFQPTTLARRGVGRHTERRAQLERRAARGQARRAARGVRGRVVRRQAPLRRRRARSQEELAAEWQTADNGYGHAGGQGTATPAAARHGHASGEMDGVPDRRADHDGAAPAGAADAARPGTDTPGSGLAASRRGTGHPGRGDAGTRRSRVPGCPLPRDTAPGHPATRSKSRPGGARRRRHAVACPGSSLATVTPCRRAAEQAEHRTQERRTAVERRIPRGPELARHGLHHAGRGCRARDRGVRRRRAACPVVRHPRAGGRAVRRHHLRADQPHRRRGAGSWRRAGPRRRWWRWTAG